MAVLNPMLKRMWKRLQRCRYKRRSVNLGAEIGVEVKKGDVSKKYLLPVRVINLSLRGCCFITNTVLLNGKHLFLDDIGSKEIEIQIHLPNNLIQTPAKVMWFDLMEDHGGFKVGLSFESMQDINLNFLKQYLSLKDNALEK